MDRQRQLIESSSGPYALNSISLRAYGKKNSITYYRCTTAYPRQQPTKLLTDSHMAQMPWSLLKLGNYQQGDYYSSNSKIKKIWGWNLKPGETIQRFNHEPFNLVTSCGESKVNPKKIPERESLAPTGKVPPGSQPTLTTEHTNYKSWMAKQFQEHGMPPTWSSTSADLYSKPNVVLFFLLRSFILKIKKSGFWLKGF